MKNLKTILLMCSLLSCFAHNGAIAQSKQPIIWWNMTWNGLRNQQPANEMPQSKAPLIVSIPKTKIKQSAHLKPINDQTWELKQGWELIEAYRTRTDGTAIFDPKLNTENWYTATVPGTILTTLVDQGIFPDPYYGLNNLAITDTLCRMDWWYRYAFVTPDDLANKNISIRFNGINYKAEVYLNKHLLGTIEGAFIRAQFDISKLLNKNNVENVLAVRILPPNNPGIPHEQSMIAGQGLNGGQLCLDGPTFISAEGWDWMPGIRDRNMGIWQSVELIARLEVQIIDPHLTSDLNLPDTTEAVFQLRTGLKNNSQNTIEGELNLKIEGTSIDIAHPYKLAAGQEQFIVINAQQYPELKLKNPKLWWPNGYGAPHLYPVEIKATANKKVSDCHTFKFGVRELSYELMVAKSKTDFRRIEFNPLKVDGKQVLDVINRVEYKKGSYAPAWMEGADFSLVQELDQSDKVGPNLVLKVNGVRIFARGGNWGMDDAMKNTSKSKMEPYFKLHQQEHFNIIRNWTGESTEEQFYALADTYGMLIWNDFWLTTENSNTDPNDHQLFIRNARDVVRRFRNHASIAIWCPRNEGFAPEELEKKLSLMCVTEDPSRLYHGQSRFLNMGDSGPWGYFTDLGYYYHTRAQGFNTEMGSYAIPTAASIRSFIAPEDQWPINDVWAYHDLHHTSQGFNLFMDAINKYGEPTNLDDFVLKAHMVNYDNWRAMLEAWNSKMWDDCTGLILWMSHPAWPSMIWQTYSWDYETPAAYFGSKKASTPLHIQLNLHDKQVVVVNALKVATPLLKTKLTYYTLDGKLLHTQEKQVQVAANSKMTCFVADTTLQMPELYLARLELFNGKQLIQTNDYWRHGTNNTNKVYTNLNTLKKGSVKCNVVSKKDNKYSIQVHNQGKQMAVAIKLNAVDKATRAILLPAYFSDGYFNLLPNQKKTIELELPSNSSFDITVTQYGF